MKKNTLIIGASDNPARYAYLAAKSLIQHQHPVFLLGKKSGQIENLPIHTDLLDLENIDTVTLYLNPTNQVDYIEYVIALAPKRVIFNPGTENPDFEKKLSENNIEAIEACTLVMLSTNQY